VDLEDVKQHAARLSMWTYFATTKADGHPHVVPVHPCWSGDKAYVFAGPNSQKARNLARDDRFSMHYTVGFDTDFDGLFIDGRAAIVTDVDRKRELWGVMDYPLEQFGGHNGPEDPDTGFLELTPTRAVLLVAMGRGGRQVWTAD
jgi:general stress protein 26